MRAASVLLAALLTTAATAQTPSSTNTYYGGPALNEQRQSEAYLRRTADCIARSDGGRVTSLLATAPGSAAEASVNYAFKTRIERCMGSINLPKALYTDSMSRRAAIAEATYHVDYPRGLELRAKSDITGQATWPVIPAGGDSGLTALHLFARCIVAADPMGTSALLESRFGEGAEAAALRHLQPTMAACMDTGNTVRTNRLTLRGVLAEELIPYADAQRRGYVLIIAPAGKN